MSSDLPSLARAILRVLNAAERPMTVNHITRQLHTDGRKTMREARVEECLKRDLRDHIKKASGRWTTLTDEPEEDVGEAVETAPSEAQGDGEAETEEVPEVSGLKAAAAQSDGEHRASHQPFPLFAPRGAAGRVTAELERAKYLALVLDLASRPMTASELAQVLDEMGLATSDEEVQRLLEGILHSYVRPEQEGWTLRPEAVPAEDSKAGAEADGPPRGDSFAKEQTPAGHALLAQTKADGREYAFVGSDLDTPALFSAAMEGPSTLQIKLNTQHPAYDLLKAGLQVGAPEAADTGMLRRLLRKTQRALRLLLIGWSRYEEDLDGTRRHRAQQARSDWGRSVRRIVRRHEERMAERD